LSSIQEIEGEEGLIGILSVGIVPFLRNVESALEPASDGNLNED
jgi:hypothetical protein